jgi:hypothetical protein
MTKRLGCSRVRADREEKAWSTIEPAARLAVNGSQSERAYINVLAKRNSKDPTTNLQPRAFSSIKSPAIR